jgi:hypothetical protein
MGAGRSLGRQSKVKHELVHYLASYVRPYEPRWLAEGLAQYFETLEISDDKRLLTVGRPDPNVVAVLHGIGIVPVNDVRAGVGADDSPGAFYARAWLTVHYLMNDESEGFRSYLAALARTKDDGKAWAAAFGGITPSELDGRLRNYFDGGQYYVYKFSFQPPDVHLTGTGPLSPADAHATRALIYTQMLGSDTSDLPRTNAELQTCARQELGAALQQDADHPLALAVKGWALGDRIEVSRAESAVARHGDDWMAWWLLATALWANGVRDERLATAVEKASTLSAANPAIALPALK